MTGLTISRLSPATSTFVNVIFPRNKAGTLSRAENASAIALTSPSVVFAERLWPVKITYGAHPCQEACKLSKVIWVPELSIFKSCSRCGRRKVKDTGPSDIRHTKNVRMITPSARVPPNICSTFRRIGIANLSDLYLLLEFGLTGSLSRGGRLGLL